MEKNYIIFKRVFLISLAVAVVFLIGSFVSFKSQKVSESINENVISAKSKMTQFDIQLAKKLMDSDNDGKCDYCGMDVDSCVDSGMLECTMDSKAKIGLLGSDHLHADFKVYINEQEIDFAQEKYFVKSAFVHVEPEKINDATGNILHIHAKGIPLWLFFESLGMRFDSDCFKLENKEEFCNNENSKLRLFVNGIENNEFGDYIPKNSDKILITYGDNDKINEQLSSITDYAKDK